MNGNGKNDDSVDEWIDSEKSNDGNIFDVLITKKLIPNAVLSNVQF